MSDPSSSSIFDDFKTQDWVWMGVIALISAISIAFALFQFVQMIIATIRGDSGGEIARAKKRDDDNGGGGGSGDGKEVGGVEVTGTETEGGKGVKRRGARR